MNKGGRTFSCWMCFNSFSSLYVLLLKTGVLNGFMIFLIATDEFVSWSFAELDKVSEALSTAPQEIWSTPNEAKGSWKE